MKKIAVFVSNKTKGSNLQAIIDAINSKKINNCKIIVVVSNKEDSFGLVRAKKQKIPTEILDLKDFISKGKTRPDYDNALGKLIKEKYNPDLIVLAGWMLILSGQFIKYFPNRIINLHPGYTQDKSTRGLYTTDAISHAIKNHYEYTGSTVHFVSEKVDEGPIILQSRVRVLPTDTVESLYLRIYEEEHKILPQAISLFCQDKIKLNNGKVIIS